MTKREQYTTSSDLFGRRLLTLPATARRSPIPQELGPTILISTTTLQPSSVADHKAKRADRATFETGRQETTQFVLAVVADTWVCELRDSDSLCTEFAPKDLFSHLQAGCTGQHALNLLALHNEMQRYHLEVEGIPKYINILEDAQQQVGRAGRTIHR